MKRQFFSFSALRRLRTLFLALLLGMVFVFQANAMAQKGTIQFVTLEWEPYYGPNLVNEGYFTDIVREAFRRVGYEISVDYVPWKRALYEIENLYYDGLLGVYYSESRAEWLLYSDPVSEAELVFFAKKGSGISWENLEDLRPYTIGIEDGYAYGNAFDAATFLKKEAVRKLELNLKKLLEGRIDLIAASRIEVLYWMTTNSPDKMDLLEVVGKPLLSNTLYITFPRKAIESAKYLYDFNRGLQSIREDDTYSKILSRNAMQMKDAE
jgi:polar amino acid transport system substrate-binding protein